MCSSLKLSKWKHSIFHDIIYKNAFHVKVYRNPDVLLVHTLNETYLATSRMHLKGTCLEWGFISHISLLTAVQSGSVECLQVVVFILSLQLICVKKTIAINKYSESCLCV